MSSRELKNSPAEQLAMVSKKKVRNRTVLPVTQMTNQKMVIMVMRRMNK
jgi:hypothetical protein